MRHFVALIVGMSLAVALTACQKAGNGAATADDMTMGNPAAKVTMIEYASVACPHCARFATEVFPQFKTKYIDSGKVRYVSREALTGDPAIAAAGFLTARCAGKDKYFQVVDAIYRAQSDIYASGDPHAALLNIARSAGLSDAQFDACIKDEAALNALNARWEKYVKDDNITGTPTFVINGKVYDKGEMSIDQLDQAIAEASGKAGS
jgi:protein-disulfide isomerase